MRHRSAASVAVALAFAFAAGRFACADVAQPGFALASAAAARVDAVVAVGMTVTDLEQSTRFFTEALDFEKIDELEASGPAYDRLWDVTGVRARIARLRLGAQSLELVEFVTPKGRPYPADARSNDRSFQHVAIVVADMDVAYARVRSRSTAISVGGPQTLPTTNTAAAGISAYYFRDPDGHALELIHFPVGKGDARWHEPRGRLFLGIDHTAIRVRATDASLALYRDVLGLAVVGESLNVGPEQEHLTGVDGARVRITGLHARAGLPGIELLDYRAPPEDGRDSPPDPRTNDAAHWYAIAVVPDAAVAARVVGAAGYVVQSAVVTLPDARLGFRRGVVVHDGDGHTLELVER